MDIATLGLSVDSRPVATAVNELDKLAASGTKVEASAKKVEQSMASAGRAINATGVSAAQTAAALRGVPAQFTDIFTSLQGGQAPMTVLLQQGGQLKDMFGGVGPAAKAMGGYIMGMVNPITLAAAAAGALAVAYYQGSKEADAYHKALVMTGNAAGVTAGQMADMAQAISSNKGTVGAAAEAIAMLAATGKVAGTDLQKFGEVAVLANRSIGTSVEDTTKAFNELGKDPVKASQKLTESMGYLTAATYEQILKAKALGDEERAASLAQGAYADAIRSRATQIEMHAGTMERAWRNVRDVAAGAWDAMLGVGRVDSAQSKLTLIKSQLDGMRNEQASGKGGKAYQDELTKQIKLSEIEAAALSGTVYQTEQVAKAESERTAANKAGVAAVDAIRMANDKYATKQEQLNKALKDYRKSLADLPKDSELLDTAKIAATEAGIRKSYTETGKLADGFGAAQDAAKEWAKQLADAEDGLSKATGKTEDLSDADRKLRDYLASVAYTINEQTNPAMNALVVSKRHAQIAQEKWNDSVKGAQKAAEEAAKYSQKLATEESKRITGLRDAEKASLDATAAVTAESDALSFEIGLIGKSTDARKLEIEQYRIRIALQKRLQDIENDPRYIGDETGAQEAAKSAARQDALTAAATAAARAGYEEWRATADRINNDLTDALLSAGKDGGAGLRKLIERELLEKPFRVFINAMISPIGNAIASALTGEAGAAGGVASGLMGSVLGSFGTSLAGLTATMGQFSTAALASTQSLLGLTGTAAQASNAAVLGAANQTGASTLASSAGSAIPYVAAAFAVAAGLGLFRSTKTVGSGIMGTVGESTDVTGYDLRRKSGYLFGGPDYSIRETALDAATAKSITDAVGLVSSGSKAYAEALNLSTDALIGFTTVLGSDVIHNDTGGIGINLTGLTSEQAVAKINEELAKVGDAYAQKLIGTFEEIITTTTAAADEVSQTWDAGLQDLVTTIIKAAGTVTTTIETAYMPSEFAREAETAGQTLARLATSIVTVNSLFDGMGKTLLASSLAGADMASSLLDSFGGIEAADAKLSSYYQNFFSAEERAANTTRLLTNTLAALGLELPTSAAGFRSLAEAQDLTTAAGRTAYATLIGVSESFLTIVSNHDSLADAYDRESESLKDIVSKFRDFGKTIRDFRKDLQIGGLSTLTPAEKYAAAAQDFQSIYTKAKAGDETALGEITGAASSLLELSRAYFGSSAGYTADFGMVQQALSDSAISAEATADVAQLQLDAMTTQVEALIDLNETASTVASILASMLASGEVLSIANAQADPIEALYQAVLGRASDAAGKQYWQQQMAGGMDLADVQSAMMAGSEYQSFDVGTNYVPRDMLAKIHEGERIVPAADNGRLMADSSAMLEEIRTLNTRIQSLERTVALSASATVSATVEVGEAVRETGSLGRYDARLSSRAAIV